ncbi:MAG: 2-(1,2-epoxy-1,2-dihydrophenyl)acetyl-CoA isomerase, partial [Rhodobacteraceae bacterium]|nr:2-(1,2-epoxy-1,2-dihydrophenyl)acetyl-CoA isomerase [Paracoccaceae bacterium]
MDYQTIKFELNDNIAVITLDRPDVMNAMSTQMRAEIQHAVKEGGR